MQVGYKLFVSIESFILFIPVDLACKDCRTHTALRLSYPKASDLYKPSGLPPIPVIKPHIKWAEKQIPKKSHKSASLFLYATARVCKLPPADSNLLLDNAWSILKTSHFMCKREWVKLSRAWKTLITDGFL
ncbi:GDA1/CD39 nucleoside phosphatase family protein [Striga asiatica]|uniref:GDA1/CD39 nucleoside phosphatase family protein n=1 Tax=Striga asiatica TaxID=4170 RepID=A0A5A7QTM2_STRAF|nr:GDA1/CD39 nucleoside phosphatase family protein [Striga asiatica]